jgi:hypothetical protein
MMVCPVGAESFHADRQTDGRMEGRRDMNKPKVAFRRFANVTANIGEYFDRSNLRIAVLSAELLSVGPCFEMERFLPRCYMTLAPAIPHGKSRLQPHQFDSTV